MKLVTYLGFDGTCREAFNFYHELLGGEITTMISNADMGFHTDDPENGARIMHARLEIGDQTVMGGDFQVGVTGLPQGFSLSIQLDSDEEARSIYDRLAEGGEIEMPLMETEWASSFAMLRDRFGTPWMINVETELAQ